MKFCNNKKCSIGEFTETEDCARFVPVKTNADRIRAMPDEELARAMAINTYTGACNDWGIPIKKCGGNCYECILDWLRQPVKEN